MKLSFIRSVNFGFAISCLIFIDLSESGEEIAEHEHHKESRTSEHEVSLGHVVFSKFLVNDDVVIVLVGFDGVEVVHEHVPGV